MAATNQNQSNLLDDLTFLSLFAVTQAGMFITTDLDNLVRPFGLSYGRFSLLLVAADTKRQPVHAAELAAMLGKSKPTLSAMIARLQADGLLVWETNAGDLRRRSLSLTGKGEALISEVIPVVNAHGRHYASRLSANDKRNLLGLLSKLQFGSPDRVIRNSM